MLLFGQVNIKTKYVDDFVLELLYINTINRVKQIIREFEGKEGISGKLADECGVKISKPYLELLKEFLIVFDTKSGIGAERFNKLMKNPDIGGVYYSDMIRRNSINVPISENFPLILIGATLFSIFTILNNAKSTQAFWVIAIFVFVAVIYLIRTVMLAGICKGYDGKRIHIGYGRQPKVVSEKAEAIELVQFLMIKYKGSTI